MKTCVVVPTYNEKENVKLLVESVKAVGVPELELLFVDDSSPDGTTELIREISTSEPWVHVLVREAKKGIGSAYQDGFRHALDSFNPDAIVEMDADLQHPPATLRDLLEAVESGADVAVASRYVRGGGISGWGSWRRLVSKGANTVARLFLGLSVKDCTSGFRAYRKAAAEIIIEARLPMKGFEFQVATLRLLKTKMKTVEVPYTFRPRQAGKSKLGFRDMVRFLFSVLRISLS